VRLRPGYLGFIYRRGESTDALVQRLEALSGWAQIVGPHGSGKSTLVRALQSELAARGCPTLLLELHDGERLLPRGWDRPLRGRPAATVFVDGFEQLSRIARIWLKSKCWYRGWNLVVTTHRPTRMATLYETRVTPQVAEQVVRTLAGEWAPTVERSELAVLLERHQGNLRELLFELYDRYEGQPPSE
jgi:GTPase SAR1 family protein